MAGLPERPAAGRRRARTAARLLSVAAAAGLLAACGAPASYTVKIHYLEKMAGEGVQAHDLIVSQGAKASSNRCTGAFNALQDQNPPHDLGSDGTSGSFSFQIEVFFVQSCISGLPKPVPGQAPPRLSSTPVPSGSSPG